MLEVGVRVPVCATDIALLPFQLLKLTGVVVFLSGEEMG